MHHGHTEGDITISAIAKALYGAFPDADAEVSGGGGHYAVKVTSAAFRGKSMVESHRLVYGALAPLLKGEQAPVHAIDQVVTVAR
jgi:stress-induced morphogen